METKIMTQKQIEDLDTFFLDATAKQLGLPVEIISDHNFREWLHRQLPGDDGSSSVAEEERAAEMLAKEAGEFLAKFSTDEETRRILIGL